MQLLRLLAAVIMLVFCALQDGVTLVAVLWSRCEVRDVPSDIESTFPIKCIYQQIQVAMTSILVMPQ
jgi:hypothetical protein